MKTKQQTQSKIRKQIIDLQSDLILALDFLDDWSAEDINIKIQNLTYHYFNAEGSESVDQ